MQQILPKFCKLLHFGTSFKYNMNKYDYFTLVLDKEVLVTVPKYVLPVHDIYLPNKKI